MCTRGGEPGDYLASIRHLIVDRVLEIRERFTKLAHELDECWQASHIPYMRLAVLMADEIRTINLRSHRQIAFTPNLVDSASCQRFILFKVHRLKSPRAIATDIGPGKQSNASVSV